MWRRENPYSHGPWKAFLLGEFVFFMSTPPIIYVSSLPSFNIWNLTLSICSIKSWYDLVMTFVFFMLPDSQLVWDWDAVFRLIDTHRSLVINLNIWRKMCPFCSCFFFFNFVTVVVGSTCAHFDYSNLLQFLLILQFRSFLVNILLATHTHQQKKKKEKEIACTNLLLHLPLNP